MQERQFLEAMLAFNLGFIMITSEYKDLGEKLTMDRLTQIHLISHFLHFLQSIFYCLFDGKDIKLTGEQV